MNLISVQTIVQKKEKSPLQRIRQNWDLYLMILPVAAYFIIFCYIPMTGIQLAFKDFVATKGIWGSPLVGFKHFERFFNGYYFWRLLRNTVGISFYQLVVGFPAPIILALMINEVREGRFKKSLQTITYAPHFLSTVVLIGILNAFLSPQSGIVNSILKVLGQSSVSFMTEPGWFKTLYILSGVWQETGFSSIIYIAALVGIDPELHASAIMDGANRLQRIIYINIPGIFPTIVILLILNIGSIMNVGFEKILLMQNDLNISASDVIPTYIYRTGVLGAQYSFTTAVGLFNSVINFVLLIIANSICRRLNETSLW